MRVLLDECVPRGLRTELPGHEVKTVAEAGWAGVKNGALLQLAANHFDVLLTVDRNLEYQQSFSGEKAALAHLLIKELHASPDADAERSWIEEAQRRYDAFVSGKLSAIPGDEVMTRAR